MFRQVFQSLTRSLRIEPKPDAFSKRVSSGSMLERVAHQSPPVRRSESAGGDASAERLCGITPGMSKGEVAAQIKLLYRRYNRAASSLDVNVRAEAERMLDAIVDVREKWIGPI